MSGAFIEEGPANSSSRGFRFVDEARFLRRLTRRELARAGRRSRNQQEDEARKAAPGTGLGTLISTKPAPFSPVMPTS